MSAIEIRNVGPISAMDIDLSDHEPGGVRILRGTSGTGKTTVLNVLQALVGDNVYCFSARCTRGAPF
ncbi:MAG: hypothetical protein ACK5PB_19230 [Pirellula sp.]|jgi:ABC-type molybdate transport system ATPase subunit